jgi:hypothetical protein
MNRRDCLSGRRLVYDEAKREVVGDREATALLRRQYRRPWKRPADTSA